MTHLKLDTKNSRRDARISKVVRERVNMTGDVGASIATEDGFSEPRVEGHRSYYTTKTGVPIRNRNAYMNSAPGAWRTIRHHAGTLTILVGRGWLIEQGLV